MKEMKHKINILEEAENEVYFGRHVRMIKTPFADKYRTTATINEGKDCFLSLEELKVFSNELLEVVEEIKNKNKFSENEVYFFVHPAGEVRSMEFSGMTTDNFNMALDNIFKTKAEAEAHREEMLARFEEARKKYVRD